MDCSTRPRTVKAAACDTADDNSIMLIQAAFFITTLLMLMLFWNGDQYAPILIQPLCILFTLHLIWCFWSWHAAVGRWFDAYTMFMLSLCLFNGGHFLLETFGLNSDGILWRNFSDLTIIRTIMLVNAGVVAYHFGGLFHVSRNRSKPVHNRSLRLQRQNESIIAKRGTAIGLFFLAVSLPATLLSLMRALEIVSIGGYMALYQREMAAGFANWHSVLSQLFLPGVLITFAMHHKSYRWIIVCWIMVLGYIVANMIIGDRGPAVSALVTMVMLHHVVVKKIPPILLMIVGLGTFALLPVIAHIRCAAFDNRADFIDNMVTDHLYVMAIREMGGSAKTIAFTTELIPQERDYDYGLSYWHAALTTFPNLFWERHPAMERGQYSHWLVWTVAPKIAANGGGLGFSVLAEAYANFSIYGPSIVMAIIGFAVSAVVSWSRNTRSPFAMAMEVVLLSVILILPRAEMFRICRSLVWLVVFPYLITTFGRTRHTDHHCFVMPYPAKQRP